MSICNFGADRVQANHCPGSVMFLIHYHQKVILYTGDIRAEAWWLQALIRNPVMVQYPHLCGHRILDKIYLDTTHISKRLTKAREFPSKSDGMRELINRVAQYPGDTVFHIQAFTLGYEEAIASLAATFASKVDDHFHDEIEPTDLSYRFMLRGTI